MSALHWSPAQESGPHGGESAPAPGGMGALGDVLARVRTLRILPVLVIADAADAVPLAAALVNGGLSCAEVTFRTPAAAEALRRMRAAFPAMLLGAGTVRSPEMVLQAREAGAQFIVAPGFSPAVVDRCFEAELPVFPGVCTPTEIERGLQRGLDVFKLFPAEAIGGAAYLQAISAPYPDVSFIPTGGIHPGNLAAYLAVPTVIACGGSWMAPAGWVAAGQFERIRSETERAVALVRANPERAL